MLTTILIDVDNTLLDFSKCAKSAIRQGFSELGLPWEEGIFTVFSTVNDDLWRQIETGELTRQRLKEIRFARVFSRCGICADGPAFEARFHDLLAQSHEPVAGALELLRHLAGRYTVCVASNASYHQQVHRLELAGMLPYVRQVFVSEQAGALKPSPAFFAWCFAQLGNPPKESVLMIGDSLTADIAGGAAFGIATCWYNHGGQPLPDGVRPDHTVAHLSEIPRFL